MAIPNHGQELLAVARIPTISYVNHLGHDEICAGLTLECITSFCILCTSKTTWNAQVVKNLMRKAEETSGGMVDRSLRGDWVHGGDDKSECNAYC